MKKILKCAYQNAIFKHKLSSMFLSLAAVLLAILKRAHFCIEQNSAWLRKKLKGMFYGFAV